MNGWQLFFWFVRAWFLDRSELTIENLAYRQQLASYKFQGKRPKIRPLDRILWVWLSRLWPTWRSALVIVQPATVIRWHRQGFRLYWSWKSRGQAGRPKVEREVRDLIRLMSRENPTWGAPRIQSELALLGHDVCEATVAKYLVRSPKPPSQTWRTFLDNHVTEIVAVDFFTVPTATFRILYVMIILCHHRRRVVHFNVTEHPTAEWAGQQMVEAFPYDQAPRFLLRDNDGTYGQEFRRRIASLDIEEVVTAKQSPWQNPYAERLIGSVRRECLNHCIVLGPQHLRRILAAYFEYYHSSRTHLSLERNAPLSRELEPPEQGKVVSIPQVGGLHHRYTRRAA